MKDEKFLFLFSSQSASCPTSFKRYGTQVEQQWRNDAIVYTWDRCFSSYPFLISAVMKIPGVLLFP